MVFHRLTSMTALHAPWRAAALGMKLVALGLAACALAPLGAAFRVRPDAPTDAGLVSPAATAWEWPTHWDGRPLRPLASTPVEQRFARQFPGSVARFDQDDRVVVMRHVTRPTRMLHPASDCFRALGYRIQTARLERDDRHRTWRCFEAERTPVGGELLRLRVCERIEPATAHPTAPDAGFTDTSAWFWAASTQPGLGPWLAITTVEVL